MKDMQAQPEGKTSCSLNPKMILFLCFSRVMINGAQLPPTIEKEGKMEENVSIENENWKGK